MRVHTFFLRRRGLKMLSESRWVLALQRGRWPARRHARKFGIVGDGGNNKGDIEQLTHRAFDLAALVSRWCPLCGVTVWWPLAITSCSPTRPAREGRRCHQSPPRPASAIKRTASEQRLTPIMYPPNASWGRPFAPTASLAWSTVSYLARSNNAGPVTRVSAHTQRSTAAAPPHVLDVHPVAVADFLAHNRAVALEVPKRIVGHAGSKAEHSHPAFAGWAPVPARHTTTGAPMHVTSTQGQPQYAPSRWRLGRTCRHRPSWRRRSLRR